MSSLLALADFILHIDVHLRGIIAAYGPLTYGILFFIVFCETGLVVMPFLPGDSLLFAAGAFAALGALRIEVLVVLLVAAAILGDAVNYSMGKFIGIKAFRSGSRIFKEEHLKRTQAFYVRYGGKTIVIARFIPIIRTFAPFVAGVGGMEYWRFTLFNVVGAILWVFAFVVGGYFFGNVPIVRENFSLVILAIIVASVSPAFIEWWKHRRRGEAKGQP
jgi:membrane-associated protein